ncbi:ATP-binding protein [Nonomuraea sp. NPDC050680]|uniref:ATP-binding protein n=1 Tax=Nonomuraea sp. NPDC050680 TaxID=3154630 RepID=UPI0033E09403
MTVRARERDAVLKALRAGVVPLIGQRHIQAGRTAELAALTGDIERVVVGGSAVRIVIGEHGAGKTFLLHLARSVALDKRLVTLHADITADHRLHSEEGQARALYTELARSMATRARPTGGALAAVVERFLSTALDEARQAGTDPGEAIRERLAHLEARPGGHDFAEVVGAYWRGHDTGDEHLKSAALRWLRAEYPTAAEARSALGVRSIIGDSTVLDHLALMSRFVRLAGYGGVLVFLDELVNLFRLASPEARDANYEQILSIIIGGVPHLGFMFGGTPEFLMDGHSGLFSHVPLRRRLGARAFTEPGLMDHAGPVDNGGPVLRLAALTAEELYVALAKIRFVYASGEDGRYLVDDDALVAFLHHCFGRVGEWYFRMPRATFKAFCDLLAVLERDSGASWRRLLPGVDLSAEEEDDRPV